MMTRTKSKNRMIYLPITVGFLIGAVSIPNFIQAQVGTYNATGIDNNSETLYEANFVASGSLSWNPINRIYAKKYNNGMTTFMGSKLILKKADQNSNSNNQTRDSSPILGGENNNNNSDNITIIGGSKANIGTHNNNATVLGTQGGTILEGNYESTPAVLIGGKDNEIKKNQDANVILGGNKNTIDSKNVTILGGKNNEIKSENTIVAGNNIQANDTTNSFVFSNSESSEKFMPESANSFYLNIKKGLGINKGAEGEGGVESNGAINMGTIDITTECTSDNIGLMGYFESCLVGCTTGSALSGYKWNLMDAHTGCIELCNENSGHCITTAPIKYDSWTGKCYGDVDIVNHNTRYCGGYANYLNQNFNVNFKRERVDKCPSTISDSSNPCLYTCIDDATVVEGICRKNCFLNEGKVVLHHGESITGYTNTTQTCASQCNQTEARLTCDDGDWKLANGNKDTTHQFTTCTTFATSGTCDGSFTLTKEEMNAHLTGNKYATCTGYSVSNQKCESYNYYKHTKNCDAGRTYNEALGYCTKDCSWNGKNDYKLGQTVTGWNATSIDCTSSSSRCESHTLTCNEDGSWGTEHSSYPYTSCTLKGKTCAGYTLSSCPANGHCGECFTYTANSPYQCLSGQNKFQLLRCDTGYTLTNNTCQPDCELPWGDDLAYGQSITAFQKTATTCPEACPRTTLTCGTNGQLNGGNASLYNQKECIITDKKCDARFNLTTNTTPGGIFDTCVGYTTDQTSCTSFTTYDLTGCQWPYLYTGDTCKAACEPLIGQTENLIQQGGIKKVQHGTTIDAYKSNSQTCTNLCSNIHTKVYCDNGTWKYSDSGTTADVGNGGYKYATCQDNNKVCTSYNSNGIKTFIKATDPKIANATLTKPNSSTESHCTPYNYNSTYDRCDIQDTYFYYKCNSTYAWNPAGTACTRCENLPANAVAISGTPQPDVVMDYRYTDTAPGKACTYKCKPGSDWLPDSKGVYACRSRCRLDGKEYKNSEKITAYKNETPICNTECEGITLTCVEGAWEGGDTNTYKYNSCKTQDNVPSHTNTNTIKTLTYIDGNADMQASSFEKRTDYYSKDTYYCRSGTGWIRQECKSGYTRGQDSNGKWKCYANCTGTARTDTGMPSGTIKHGTTKTGYISPKTCNSSTNGQTCSSTTLICSDGNLLIKSSGANGNAYNHESCILQSSNPNNCDKSWTTTKPDSSIYTYTGCTEYPAQTNNPLQCTTLNHYKITGCVSSDKVLVDGQCVNICSPSTYPGCNGGIVGNGTTGLTGYTCGSTACNCSSLGDDRFRDNVSKKCEQHDVDDACGKNPEHYICGRGREKIGSTSGNETDGYTWTCHTQRGNRTETCHEDGKKCILEAGRSTPTQTMYIHSEGGYEPKPMLTCSNDCTYTQSNTTTSPYWEYTLNTPFPNQQWVKLENSCGLCKISYDGETFVDVDCDADLPTYECQGTPPTNTISYEGTPTYNKTWTYDPSLSSACTWKCSNDKEVYTGCKCQEPLGWEREFYDTDGTKLNSISRSITNKYDDFRETPRIDGAYFSRTNARPICNDPYGERTGDGGGDDVLEEICYSNTSNLTYGQTSQWGLRKWDWNVNGSLPTFTNSAWCRITSNDSNKSATVNIDLTNFTENGIPIVSTRPNYSFSVGLPFVGHANVNLSFSDTQPSITRYLASQYEGQYSSQKQEYTNQKRDFYGYMLRGVVRRGSTRKHEAAYYAIEPVKREHIVAESVPIFANYCGGGGDCTYNGNKYGPNETIKAYTTSSAYGSCPSKITFYCNNGSWHKSSLNGAIGTPYANCTVSSYSGGGGCFLSGTQVITNNGSKNIEDIQTGDIILSYNEKTKTNELDTVVRPFVFEDIDEELYELSINGNVLKVTHGHRFYVLRESDYQCSTFQWIAAEKLEIGDILMDYDGNYLTIDNIMHYPFKGTVYNMQIENNHNFYVDQGYLVHNAMVEKKYDEEILK